MRVTQRSRSTQTEAGTLFVERRPPSGTFIFFLICAVIGPVWYGVREFLAGEEFFDFLPYALVGLVVAVGLIAIIQLGPMGVELKHIRVDQSGLTLGRKHLPARYKGVKLGLGQVRIMSSPTTASRCSLSNGGRGCVGRVG
jgi:hypothetical protein